MRSHPLNVNAQLSSGTRGLNDSLRPCLRSYFVYATAKALARLCGCAGSSEHPLLAYGIITQISCTDQHLLGKSENSGRRKNTQVRPRGHFPADHPLKKLTGSCYQVLALFFVQDTGPLGTFMTMGS